MRRLLKIVGGLLLLLVLAIVAIPFVIPVETLKNQAVSRIEAMTGRTVSMGEIKLSLFPSIALSASDVKIGNPDWVKGGGNMAEVKNLRIGVELMPLLHKDVHVTDLELKSPSIHLIKNGDRANWQFAPLEETAQKEARPVAKTSEGKKDVSPPVRLDSVSISDGMLSFDDSATGKKQTLSEVNLRFSGADMQKEIKLSGSAFVNGKKTSMDMTIGSPLGFASGTGASPIALKLAYDALKADIEGKAAMVKSVPQFTGTVRIPELDIKSMTVGEEGGAAAKSQPRAQPAGGGRWSDKPIRLDVPLELGVKLEVGKLILPQTTFTNVNADVKYYSSSKIAGFSVDNLAAYNGTVSVNIMYSPAKGSNFNVKLANVDMQPLLEDFAHSKVFSGTLNGEAALTARGDSERALISSLGGTGNFLMKDGSYKGGNLLNMTKNIATSFQGGQSKGEKTDFSKLSGTFVATNGVFTNNDLVMEGPLLSLTGKGDINLPEWLVHYLLTPVVITNRGNETQAASGISVPVQVVGPLDAPSYHPDLRGAVQDALKDPAKLKDNIKDIKKNLNKDTLKNLLR